jgi:integrase
MRKPTKWPDLGYGGGTWEWDEPRKQCVIRFTLGGKRVRVRSSDTTDDAIAQRDAMRRGAEVEDELMANLHRGRATVVQMMDEWLAFTAKSGAPGTDDQRRVVRNIVARQPIGSMMSREVRLGDVERMYVDLKKVYGRSKMNTIRGCLGQAFKFGVRQGFCEHNPVQGSEFGGGVRPPKDHVWLDADEFPRMRTYLNGQSESVYVALSVILLCGLRPGEVLALRWDSIDFDTGRIRVWRNVQRSHGGRVYTVVEQLKTTNSLRTVEMPLDLSSRLRKLHQERPFGPIFVNGQGNALTFYNMRLHCQKACTAIGAGDVTPHGLRHSNGSYLLDLGMKPAFVAQHLGHTLAVFLKTYQHKMREVVSTAAALGDGTNG